MAYEQLCDSVTRFVQELLVRRCDMQIWHVPFAEDNNGTEAGACPIFVSSKSRVPM